MEILFLIIGILIGAGLVLLVLRPRLRGLVVQADRAVDLDRQLVQSQADLSHERERAAERLTTLQDAQRQLGESFKALSADALQSSIAQLTEMARAQQQTAQAKADGELEQRRRCIRQVGQPPREAVIGDGLEVEKNGWGVVEAACNSIRAAPSFDAVAATRRGLWKARKAGR